MSANTAGDSQSLAADAQQLLDNLVFAGDSGALNLSERIYTKVSCAPDDDDGDLWRVLVTCYVYGSPRVEWDTLRVSLKPNDQMSSTVIQQLAPPLNSRGQAEFRRIPPGAYRVRAYLRAPRSAIAAEPESKGQPELPARHSRTIPNRGAGSREDFATRAVRIRGRTPGMESPPMRVRGGHTEPAIKDVSERSAVDSGTWDIILACDDPVLVGKRIEICIVTGISPSDTRFDERIFEATAAPHTGITAPVRIKLAPAQTPEVSYRLLDNSVAD